jgi:hypothetical protein
MFAIRSTTATARLGGVCYLLTIVTGMAGELVPAPVWASTLATLLSFGFYGGVTWYLYRLFAPTNRPLAGLAAGSSLLGCALGVLKALALTSIPLSSLVFFGFYCVLTGYLIWRSRLLPPWLGGLLAVSGLGWLTFLSPQFAHSLAPYHLVSGLVGEGALTLWLLLGRIARPEEAVPETAS